MLSFTFLGTSSGVPTQQRNVSGLAVQPMPGSGWFLIDAGEGTQQQLQKAGLSLRSLQAICITHVHGDHCFGLPGLLASAGMAGRTEPMVLISPLPVWTWLEATRSCTDLHLPYEIRHVDSALTSLVWQSQGLRITAHALKHRVPCFAYLVEVEREIAKLDIQALRERGLPPGPAWKALQLGDDVEFDGAIWKSVDFVDRQTQTVAAVFAGDNADPSVLREACLNAQVLVHEATYTQEVLDRVGPGPMHSSAQAVAAFAEGVQLPHLVLTHFSARHHDAQGQSELETEARASFTGAVWLAKDFDTFELNSQGLLQLQPSGGSVANGSTAKQKFEEEQ